MFTVRRIVQGEGVERKFPLHSPRVAKIVVQRAGVTRRAKLYYLRDRVGKAVRLKERRVDQTKRDQQAKGGSGRNAGDCPNFRPTKMGLSLGKRDGYSFAGP